MSATITLKVAEAFIEILDYLLVLFFLLACRVGVVLTKAQSYTDRQPLPF